MSLILRILTLIGWLAVHVFASSYLGSLLISLEENVGYDLGELILGLPIFLMGLIVGIIMWEYLIVSDKKTKFIGLTLASLFVLSLTAIVNWYMLEPLLENWKAFKSEGYAYLAASSGTTIAFMIMVAYDCVRNGNICSDTC